MSATSEQEKAGQNKKIGTELAQTKSAVPISRLGKSHPGYWQERLEKRQYHDRGGELATIPEWQVRIHYRGRREWFNLTTGNKTAAAAKARDIYLSLVSSGWESTLAKFKPKVETPSLVTVGEFLNQVKAVSNLKPVTFEIYGRKFRTLVAGVFNLHGGKEKFDYVNGGYQKWLERVHRIRLERITPKRVQTWKVNYLKQEADPLSLKRAQTTVNSIIRGAKALFSPDVLKLLPGTIPNPLAGVDNVPISRKRFRYRSEFNPQLLLVQAKRELKEAEFVPLGPEAKPYQVKMAEQAHANKQEMFKILLLALCVGLRRDEIDTLCWRQFNWTKNQISIETTVHTSAKSDDSENAVYVDPDLMALFKEYMATSQSEFVIASPVKPRPMARYHHYRCNRLFDHLIKWLRSKGVNGLHPIHVQRKEFGSAITAQAGIFAASAALRHSDIQLTRNYYADRKSPTVFEVGKILAPDPVAASKEA